MLVKRSNKKTRFVLPVLLKNSNKQINWYYDSEFMLQSAYRQLKKINIGIIPSQPIIN